MTATGRAAGAGALRPDDVRDMLERQTAVLELIAAATPLREVLTHILTSLELFIPGARCSVLLLDREHGTLHHGAAPSLPGGYVAAIDGMAIGDGAGSCGTAAALNRAVVARDVRRDVRWVSYRPAAEAAGLRSCWSTPIEGPDGLPVGTFAVYHPEPHRPTRREQLLVERFTHLASVAIEHADVLGELVESEERFRRSFDDNSLGMAIVGLDRAVVTTNTALTAVLGERRADLVGRRLAEVVTPVDGPLDARLDGLGRDDAAPVVFEAVLHRRSARAVEVEVTVSLVHARDGGPGQYVVNVFDLTERRAAEQHRRARLEAETARRTAEQLLRARSALLAAVGHEARTPIQAIVGFAELLGTLELDEAQRREALGRIDAAAGHVMDLLADVLDLSRLEAGALPVALEPVLVRDVVVEVLGLLSPAADRREVDLSMALLDDVVLADRRRLRQVLLNLVGNSIRHGAVGGDIAVRTRPAGEGWVVVAVDDDGPGIPPDLLPRVFTPFAAASAPEREAAEGGAPDGDSSIGLGLGLAHGLVEAMGGELTVASSSPAGTSVQVRLRRAPPDA
ncbi:ATP-binding protein [Phycicoccus duodecadis]|uniref:histidine kinase n=1 Tax=Phycicoccus duodecadis TaxID=173053 RepID=A0A2N3YH54_9MICO|nr:ATP-binding protein [Phycicoccus duodecadis]PKW26166.1 PAS domain S-box-containing protein [Phycicoccus duodecadis]